MISGTPDLAFVGAAVGLLVVDCPSARFCLGALTAELPSAVSDLVAVLEESVAVAEADVLDAACNLPPRVLGVGRMDQVQSDLATAHSVLVKENYDRSHLLHCLVSLHAICLLGCSCLKYFDSS